MGKLVTTQRSAFVLAACLFACSGSEGSDPSGGEGKSPSDGENGPDAALEGGDDGGISGGDPGSDSGGEVPVASPEVCDGIDNDLDGFIDNIDVEKDGVCDCLNIATIGQIGGWSTGGNVFQTWLNERSPMGAVEIGDQVLTDELLRPFQVIVVLHVGNEKVSGGIHELTPHHEFSADEAAAVERWVRGGGGLMTTIGYGDEVSEVVNVNRLLTPLKMAYSTTKKDTNGFVQSWQTHPVTENVKKINTSNGVQPDGAEGITLANDGSGRVAMQVTQADAGRVIVWGDEWITYDSEWEDTQDQQVDRLWLNMLKWMSPPLVCQVALPPVVLQ